MHPTPLQRIEYETRLVCGKYLQIVRFRPRSSVDRAAVSETACASSISKHLRLAIDRHEPFRSLAAEDSDFDPIRDEAAFKELVQGNAAKTMG